VGFIGCEVGLSACRANPLLRLIKMAHRLPQYSLLLPTLPEIVSPGG
jgi:hypothetical protein